ncbi:MAG: hypothetical protein HQM03_13590 [Magnetococcales bacterium]|nr:hypothetical protein [Magnetococcales bacterium]
MTSLIVWVGVDQRSPASVYIASDSRISWGNCTQWNCGSKLFTSPIHPIIASYTGDSVFSVSCIHKIIERIQNKLLDFKIGSLGDKIKLLIATELINYPKTHFNNSDIVIVVRQDGRLKLECNFILYHYKCYKNGSISFTIDETKKFKSSEYMLCLGTGKNSVEEYLNKWRKSDASGTSRAIFSAFSDALSKGSDTYSSAPPQLCGLYRIGNGKKIGIIMQGKRFFDGTEITEKYNELNNIEWRNELFERCDGKTASMRTDAQPQPRPKQTI